MAPKNCTRRSLRTSNPKSTGVKVHRPIQEVPGGGSRVRGQLKRFVLLTGLGLSVGSMLILAFMQPIAGARQDFSSYNGRWNGASDVIGDLHASPFGFDLDLRVSPVHRSLALHDFPDSLLILGPEKDLAAADAAWLREYVQQGGKLLLADDFGTGNQFLEAIGSTARFQNSVVRDLSYSKNSDFVLSSSLRPHWSTSGVAEVILDLPGSIQPGLAQVLALTLGSSWIDKDNNGAHNDEPVGAFPWLAIESIGLGEVVILSDPSLLINGVRDLSDNHIIADNLASWLHGKLLIDESHRSGTDPVHWYQAIAAKQSRIFLGIVAVAGSAIAALIAHPRPRRAYRVALAFVQRNLQRFLGDEPALVKKDPVERVIERHPDWDETTIRRLASGWKQ